MKEEMTVRKATIGDLGAVSALFRSAIAVMNESGIPQWDEVYPSENDFKNDIGKEQMFLCEYGDRTAAVFVLNRQRGDEYQNGAWNYAEDTSEELHRLCVDPTFQNRGVGAQAVRLAEALLRERGTESIRLDAFSKNPYALRLYEKLGYRRVGEANFRKGLFYLYEKRL